MVLPFDGRIRGWKQIGFKPPHKSLDPNAPVAYIVEIVGERSDGVVFEVRLALKQQSIDILPKAEDVMNVLVQGMNQLFVDLNSFRDCKCTSDTSCKDHQRQ